MTVATDDFSAWLLQARVVEHRLTPDQRGVLVAAFHFRPSRGDDSYSTRLLSHFLLHARTVLQVAQIARLVGVSRPTASGQHGLSSKQAVQQAHHRLDGRPYGKLLPRFAGPLLEFLLARPQATRADLIDFIDQSFGVHVSRIALYKFLKKFGLDRVGASAPGMAPAPRPVATPAATSAAPLLLGRTRFAGAFLMLGQARAWLAVAQDCFTDDYGTRSCARFWRLSRGEGGDFGSHRATGSSRSWRRPPKVGAASISVV